MTDFPNFPFSWRFESREGYLASVTVENATALYNYDTSGLFLNESETPNLGDKGHLTHSDVLGRLDQLDAVHFVYGPNGQITSATNGAQSWKFYCDEDGQRIYKTSVSGTIETPVAAFPSVG